MTVNMGVRKGEQGEQMLPPGFGHLVEHLVRMLTFCVTILACGLNTSICSPLKKICSPYKNPCGRP